MKRLFQDYQGEIKSLAGIELHDLKCIYDQENNDLIILWIQSIKSWLRIFIDGAYCGVDEYLVDGSLKDFEETDVLVNHKDWIDGSTIKFAIVESLGLPEIKLTIALSNDYSIVLNCDNNEFCSLRKLETSSLNISNV